MLELNAFKLDIKLWCCSGTSQQTCEFPVTGAITWRFCGWFSEGAVSPQVHQPEQSKDICPEPVDNSVVRALTPWMCCHCLVRGWLEKRDEKARLGFRSRGWCFCPWQEGAGGCSMSLGGSVCGCLFRNTVPPVTPQFGVSYNGIGSNPFLCSSNVLLQTDLSSQTLNQAVPTQCFPVLLGKSYFDWWKSELRNPVWTELQWRPLMSSPRSGTQEWDSWGCSCLWWRTIQKHGYAG